MPMVESVLRSRCEGEFTGASGSDWRGGWVAGGVGWLVAGGVTLSWFTAITILEERKKKKLASIF